jgi:hypothetical protein
MGGKRRAGWPFSLVIFLLTPGFLPFALRAGFAVRTRSCACVATQRESNSAAEGRRKLFALDAPRASRASALLQVQAIDRPSLWMQEEQEHRAQGALLQGVRGVGRADLPARGTIWRLLATAAFRLSQSGARG